MKKTLPKLLLVTVTLLVVLNMQHVLAQVTPQLIGMAQYNGAFNEGTIFKINSDGTGLETLHDFNGHDGGNGVGSLTQASNGLLYGMTYHNGMYGVGTIFQMKHDGTGLTVLHHFDNMTGRYTNGSLMQGADGALYGMAYTGGFVGSGTIFRIEMNGLGFKVLHHFNNVDGGVPQASLIQLPDGKLYGIALGKNAVIFRINADGTDYEVVRDINDCRGSGTLVLGHDGALYGVTSQAFGGNPAIYKLNPDGSEFRIIRYLFQEFGRSPGSLTQAPDGRLYLLNSRGGVSKHYTSLRWKADLLLYRNGLPARFENKCAERVFYL